MSAMSYESNGTMLIDEIDRLFVVYDKAKDYVTKILTGIDDQIGLWQHRRQIILDQMKSTSSSSFEFLLPKTQRINELAIEAVQALCRVDLLIEQTLRIDPKSVLQIRTIPTSTSFSARTISTNIPHPTANTMISQIRHPVPSPVLNITKSQFYTEPISNGKILEQQQQSYPMPVLRTQQQTSSSRSSTINTQEKAGFKPIEQQQQQQQQQQSSILSDSTLRPTPFHPQSSLYPATEKMNFARPVVPSFSPRALSSDHTSPPMAAPSTSEMTSHLQAPHEKVKVKLQRIPPGTIWKKAKIEIIDSLSAFYVENLDLKVHQKFATTLEDLHDYYTELERRHKLKPLENMYIGDFGVAKYSEDGRWYRARLLMLEENNQIRIVFIDFGNVEIKSIDEFFPLDKLYTDLPAQAIACTLSNAFPCTLNGTVALWPQDTVQTFRDEVTNKEVEVTFVKSEDGAEQWPLHFVSINVGNQTVTNLLSLKQRIEPKTNRFIAEHLASSLSEREYMLFNVPMDDDEYDQ